MKLSDDMPPEEWLAAREAEVSKLRQPKAQFRSPGRRRGGRGAHGAASYLAVLDFENGVYTLNGVSKTLSQVFENNEDYGTSWNEADVTPGVGWTKSTGFSSAALTAAFASALLPGTAGMTYVVDYTLTTTGDGVAKTTSAYLYVPDFAPEYTTSAPNNTNTNLTDDTTSLAFGVAGDGHHKFAVTLSDANCAGSLDGGAVQSFTPDAPTTPQNLIVFAVGAVPGVDTATAVVKSITIYAPKANGDLPALSALA